MARTLLADRRRFILWMLLPAVVFLLSLTLFPFLVGAFLSLTGYTLLEGGAWTFLGFSNYTELMGSADFWSAFRVTVVFTFVAVSLQLMIGVGIAVLLHQERKSATWLRTIYLLPMAITPVAATFSFRMMLNPNLGVINHMMKALGLPPQAWLAAPELALPTLILVDSWQWTPFIILITAGGLAALPEEPFEAATIDGANGWQSFWHIMLPMLKPFLVIAVTFRAIDAFKTFDIIFVLTGGGPGITTRSLNLLAYNHGIKFLSMGYAAAITILMLIVTVVACQVFLRKTEMFQPSAPS
ncbi:MAG: carbohydrate ABC transporter permease [Geminicoccaceae bacterium]